MDFRDQRQCDLGLVSDFLESAAKRANEPIGLSSGDLGLWLFVADLCHSVRNGSAATSSALADSVPPSTDLAHLRRCGFHGVPELGRLFMGDE